MKWIIRISVVSLISFASVFSVAVADAGIDGAHKMTELKKQELDHKRARLRESLKQDQAHSLQKRALEKQKKHHETDKTEFSHSLRKQKNAESLDKDVTKTEALKSSQVASEYEKASSDSDDRTRAFQDWINSNMLLNSDSKISHKEAMKDEQREELKKSLLESDSETVIVKKSSVGKIEKVNKK